MPYFSWGTLWGIGAILLLVGLVWGTMASRRRDRRNDPVTEKATRALQEDPERYETEIKPKLEKELRK